MRMLSVTDFEEFFREVHGRDQVPFPWQTDLLQRIVNEHVWPAVIDLPTGSGKTTCIDIAVFALAMDASESTPWCPRRIVMVVDRRVVVDQAASRARVIARALRSPQGSVTSEVARALSGLSCDGSPLRAAVLRGGIPRDRGWARSPDEPLVLASTVDQIGSRLLFRGYGVSTSMAPVHAGLLGSDTLIFLDEVHLSRPFQQTLEALTVTRGDSGQRGAIHVVSLSATPGATRTPPFRLSSKDRKEGLLADRLGVTKPTRLAECTDRDELADVAAKFASELLGRGHHAVAVVVNRVKSAHDVARKLLTLHRAGSEVDLVLLTGRMRPLDRDDLVRAIEPRIGAIRGRRRENQGKPLVVVATQCIEAGADFDFDALVTEHASLDALRQRFGRVDRLGEYKRAEGVAIAVLEEDDKGKLIVPKDDPVYGDTLARCWTTLQKFRGKKGEVVDFGVDALDSKLKVVEDVTALLAPKTRAPAFFPAYLDLWAQTAPLTREAASVRSRVVIEPDLPTFLHGPQAGPADIQIVWRVDLDDPGVWDASDDADPPVFGRVAALPPTSLEAVSVPLGVARRWLAGEKDFGLLADVERSRSVGGVQEGPDSTRSAGLRAILWRGDASLILQRSRLAEITPGDTIVVPASQGGLFMGNFDPVNGGAPVIDIGERANLLARGKAVLRLHAGVLGLLELGVDANGDVQAPAEPAPWLLALLSGLVAPVRVVVDDQLTVLRGRRRVDVHLLGDEAGEDETTDDEISSFTGRAVRLKEHSRHVGQLAQRFGEKVGLAPPLVGALALAGWLHDIGKADTRFQRLLRDGSEITLMKDQERDPLGWQLAKSATGPDERRRRRQASRRSGYPKGARHEVLSLAMIEKAVEVRRAAVRYRLNDRDVELDFDLVLYLVASHHGWCRPFPPAIDDAEDLIVKLRHGEVEFQSPVRHGLERVDGGCVDRFFLLGRKYGWHKLAWLEAILRLADHRASEAESENGST